ncbi:hypothetical protein AB833_27895 [Chromatiales bacterium (ex Bugula neritina AB1)]|nr:hypothetical protein AB833_27895 [Chromatiales bacterium (ex Bugula neritina AB1)]
MNLDLFRISASLIVALAFFTASTVAFSSIKPDLETEILDLQQRWDVANFQQLDKKVRHTQLTALEVTAASVVAAFPDRAEPLIWHGIIKSTLAGLNGGLTALRQVKQARSLFERAININSSALRGAAYTSLGALYTQVPPWPIAFGSNKKARINLERGLAINPDGLDANYFYAGFLEKTGNIAEAVKVLQAALRTNDRPGRAVADTGRKLQIERDLARLRRQASIAQ